MKKTTWVRERKRGKTALRVIALNISFLMVFLNAVSLPSGFAGNPPVELIQRGGQAAIHVVPAVQQSGHNNPGLQRPAQSQIPMGGQLVDSLAPSSSLLPASPNRSRIVNPSNPARPQNNPAVQHPAPSPQRPMNPPAPGIVSAPARNEARGIVSAPTRNEARNNIAAPVRDGVRQIAAPVRDRVAATHVAASQNMAAPKSLGVRIVAAPKSVGVPIVAAPASAVRAVAAPVSAVHAVAAPKSLGVPIVAAPVRAPVAVAAPASAVHAMAAPLAQPQASAGPQLSQAQQPNQAAQPRTTNSSSAAGSHSQQQPRLEALSQPQPASQPVSQRPFQKAVDTLLKDLDAIQAGFNLNQADGKSVTERFNRAEDDGRKRFSTAFNSAQTQAQRDSTNWQKGANTYVEERRAEVRDENDKALTAFNDHFKRVFYPSNELNFVSVVDGEALNSVSVVDGEALNFEAISWEQPSALERAIRDALKKFTDETDTAITKLNTDTKKVHDTADKEITRLKNELSKETEKAKKDIQNALKTGETAIDEAAKLPRTEGLLEVTRARRGLENAGIEAGNNLEEKGVEPFFRGIHTALVKHDRDFTDALNRNSL